MFARVDLKLTGKNDRSWSHFIGNTSIFLTSSLAEGADTMMPRALGLINPSSTASSMNDNSES